MVTESRLRTALTAALIASLALAGALPACAFSVLQTKPIEELLDPGDPYQAFAIVAGYDREATRLVGFGDCLREVLVRVSGEPRLEQDPRVAALAAHAVALVASYDYSDFLLRMQPVHDDQGTGDERPYDLVVRFDHAKIDATLRDLGAPAWPGPRPELVPVLWVKGFSGTYLLSAEAKAAAEQRGSLAAAAAQYGMPLHLPSEAELAAWSVAPGEFPEPRAAPQDGRMMVAGTLEFTEAAPGWTGHWRMRWHGADYVWGVSGVNYDTAFRSLIRGATRVAAGRGMPD
jgi:uncharacterized protein